MAAKITLPNADDLIRRYRAGESLLKLATEAGCSRGALSRIIAEAGEKLRGTGDALRQRWRDIKATPGGTEAVLGAAWDAARQRDAFPALRPQIASMYASGIGSPTIAAELGISKFAVLRRVRADSEVRPRSRAASIRIDQEGGRESVRRRMRIAGTHERHAGNRLRPHEEALACALEARGLTVTRKKAIGTRNVDIALNEVPVAIEVLGAHGLRSKVLVGERIEHLLRAGQFVLHILAEGDADIAASMAEQAIAFAEFVRAHPSPRGQYGVIDGQGQPVALPRNDIDHLSRVPGF